MKFDITFYILIKICFIYFISLILSRRMSQNIETARQNALGWGIEIVLKGIVDTAKGLFWKCYFSPKIRTSFALFPMCNIHPEDYEQQICMLKGFVSMHDCLDVECPVQNPNGQCEKGIQFHSHPELLPVYTFQIQYFAKSLNRLRFGKPEELNQLQRISSGKFSLDF